MVAFLREGWHGACLETIHNNTIDTSFTKMGGVGCNQGAHTATVALWRGFMHKDVASRGLSRSQCSCIFFKHIPTWARALLWSSRVSAVMFSAGIEGACSLSIKAFVFAGLATTRTCSQKSANLMGQSKVAMSRGPQLPRYRAVVQPL